MNITIELEGTSPLLMHNPQMVDHDHPIVREIKVLTAKKKKTDEDRRQIERLEWYGGMYSVDGVVTQPSSKVRKCLINTARISKSGKMAERALSFSTLNVPLVYEGPKDIDKLFSKGAHVSKLSVGVGGKRVMRVRPQFFPWALRVDGLFVEDAGLNLDDLVRIVELAGVVEGIGDNRVNGYGRFIGKVTAR
jgi:hypothetical protein